MLVKCNPEMQCSYRPLARASLSICTSRQSSLVTPRSALSRKSPIVLQQSVWGSSYESGCSQKSRWSASQRLPRLRAVHCSALDGNVTQTEAWSRQLSSDKPLTVLEGREWLRQTLQPEALRIAGVTFDDRQQLIARLQPGKSRVTLHALPHLLSITSSFIFHYSIICALCCDSLHAQRRC